MAETNNPNSTPPPTDEEGCFPHQDTVPVEDGFDTQVLNFGGETQLVDDPDRLEDLVITQLVDHQVSIDSDEDGSGGTQLLGGFDDDEIKRGGEMGRRDEEVEILSSGTTLRFTSVRAASMRASGLAARNAAMKRTNGKPFRAASSSPSSEQHVGKINGQKHDVLDDVGTKCVASRFYDEVKELKAGNKHKMGSSAVRKLFVDDEVDDANVLIHNMDSNELQPSFNDGMAGLSYVDSQEPGELSQAIALACVEKLIDESKTLFDDDPGWAKRTVEKSFGTATVKGPQSLAKQAHCKGTNGKRQIFEWDDNREDEGGGDFFSKKKDEIFDSAKATQKASAKSQKLKGNQTESVKITRRKSNLKSAKTVHCDSKIELNKLGVKGKTAHGSKEKMVRYLVDDFDKISTVEQSAEQFDPNISEKGMQETLNVGFDTQMAAEAMEALLNGEEERKCSASDDPQCVPWKSEDAHKESSTSNKRRITSSKQCFQESRYGARISANSQRSKRTRAKSSKKSPLSSEKHADHHEMMGGTSENKKSELRVNESGALENITLKSIAKGGGMSCPWRSKRGRTQLKESDHLKSHSTPSLLLKDIAQSASWNKRSRSATAATNTELNMKRQRQSTISACLDPSSADENPKEISLSNLVEQGPDLTEVKDNPEPLLLAEKGVIVSMNKLPKQKNNARDSSTSPATCMAPASVASPICVGDRFIKQSCKKDLSTSCLVREINSLGTKGEEFTSMDLRKRRDLTSVKVLFSRHLDDTTLKQQRKIADRLNISVVSSILDATHFIANNFVRTRNMLEAIASGKLVVTHLWLENVGRANYYVDEQKYILRDTEKEKEFGFNMSISLTQARHHPLLLGRRVFITSNAKPGKDVISSLVKAVHGQALKRVGRTALKDDKIGDDLLILSSEEDYELCLPFIQKGAVVYSSELLLNGIVTQRLEYERHRLFADHVKTTRSTVCLKKDSHNFVPLKKHK